LGQGLRFLGWAGSRSALKQRFCDALMAKYHGRDVGRPKGFYPRLDHITVYAIEP
jgi:hypothetical protein